MRRADLISSFGCRASLKERRKRGKGERKGEDLKHPRAQLLLSLRTSEKRKRKKEEGFGSTESPKLPPIYHAPETRGKKKRKKRGRKKKLRSFG